MSEHERKSYLFRISFYYYNTHLNTSRTLLITLNIIKALTTECRRDLSLLSASLMSSLDATLGALPNDLEVAAKVATVVCIITCWAQNLKFSHFALVCRLGCLHFRTATRSRPESHSRLSFTSPKIFPFMLSRSKK